MFSFAACCCQEEDIAAAFVVVPTEDARADPPGTGAPKVEQEDEKPAEGSILEVIAVAAQPPPPEAEPELAVVPVVPDPPAEFTASLVKAGSGEKIGLRLELFENSTAYIAEVEDDPTTLASKHNAATPEHLRICKGFYIVSANGKTTNAEISSLLKSSTVGQVDLVIRRPTTKSASFKKNGLPLGLMLKYDKNGDTLLVMDVDASGAVSVADANVRLGDRITAVNSTRGSVAAMLDELKDSDKLDLAIMRL